MARNNSDAALPATLRRSSGKAQRTYAETLESAEQQYGADEARAHQVAYSSLKHSFEKVGAHWEAKAKRGPSDPQAAQGGLGARHQPVHTAQGVDANASKAHLEDVAKRLEIKGRSRMTKAALIEAIKVANRRQSAAAR